MSLSGKGQSIQTRERLTSQGEFDDEYFWRYVRLQGMARAPSQWTVQGTRRWTIVHSSPVQSAPVLGAVVELTSGRAEACGH